VSDSIRVKADTSSLRFATSKQKFNFDDVQGGDAAV